MKKLWTIAKEYFRDTVHSKGFIIVTILGPFVIVGILLLQVMVFGDEDFMKSATEDEKIIKAIGISEKILEEFKTPALFMNITLIHSTQNEDEIREELFNSDINGYLVFPNINTIEDLMQKFNYTYKSNKSDLAFELMLNEFFNELIITIRLQQSNLDVMEIQSITREPTIKTIKITEDDEDHSDNIVARIFTILGFALLLYLTVLIYGQSVGMSVVEEKTSKTIEIILSSAEPTDLMFGMVLGLCATAILQYLVWGVMVTVAIEFILPLLNINVDFLNIGANHFIFLIIFFILGFFLYSSGFALIGAGSNETQNYSQKTFPLIINLIVALTLVNISFYDPEALLLKIFSYYPFTSPIIMLARIFTETVSVLEIVLSILVLIASIIGMGILASKVFRVGILLSGKKFSLKEIFKWSTYK